MRFIHHMHPPSGEFIGWDGTFPVRPLEFSIELHESIPPDVLEWAADHQWGRNAKHPKDVASALAAQGWVARLQSVKKDKRHER